MIIFFGTNTILFSHCLICVMQLFSSKLSGIRDFIRIMNNRQIFTVNGRILSITVAFQAMDGNGSLQLPRKRRDRGRRRTIVIITVPVFWNLDRWWVLCQNYFLKCFLYLLPKAMHIIVNQFRKNILINFKTVWNRIKTWKRNDKYCRKSTLYVWMRRLQDMKLLKKQTFCVYLKKWLNKNYPQVKKDTTSCLDFSC